VLRGRCEAAAEHFVDYWSGPGAWAALPPPRRQAIVTRMPKVNAEFGALCSFFRRDGDNLRLDLPVTLAEAVHGAKVKVPTAEGAVMLTVAPGTTSGKTLRLKEKGMSRKDGGRGDQLVTVQVDLPDADSAAGAELKRRLDGWHDDRNPRARLGV